MRTLEIELLGEFESIFETALVHESGDQLGNFGQITFDKKISRYCPFKAALSLTMSQYPQQAALRAQKKGKKALNSIPGQVGHM